MCASRAIPVAVATFVVEQGRQIWLHRLQGLLS
jgi:hypothetical protein